MVIIALGCWNIWSKDFSKKEHKKAQAAIVDTSRKLGLQSMQTTFNHT
jgi:hypothetical protein